MNASIQEPSMEKTRLSLFYLAGYLIPSGVMLLFAPRFALKLLLSNSDYGDVFPRAAGMLLIGLGIMIVQMIRLRLSLLYSTTLIVRGFFFVCLSSFYVIYHDPFFFVLLVIVSIGIVLTATSYFLDQQRVPKPSQEP